MGRLLPEVYGLIGSRRGIDIMFQDIEGFNALEYLGGNFPGACQVTGPEVKALASTLRITR